MLVSVLQKYQNNLINKRIISKLSGVRVLGCAKFLVLYYIYYIFLSFLFIYFFFSFFFLPTKTQHTQHLNTTSPTKLQHSQLNYKLTQPKTHIPHSIQPLTNLNNITQKQKTKKIKIKKFIAGMKVHLFIILGGGVAYLQGWPFLCHRCKCALFYTDKINLLPL